MAKRPAWSVINKRVTSRDYEFIWNSGLSIQQKQKNIKALHQSIKDCTDNRALEISSKSSDELGRQLSAFSLKLNNFYLENIFQSSKKYEFGGPYIGLLKVTPKEAKQDERHRTSGKLISFVCDGIEWTLEPKTAFYDYIYVCAVLQNFGKELSLDDYDWFTDIEFNPNKSINCQARSIAIYKLLQEKQWFHVLNNVSDWLEFHKTYVDN